MKNNEDSKSLEITLSHAVLLYKLLTYQIWYANRMIKRGDRRVDVEAYKEELEHSILVRFILLSEFPNLTTISLEEVQTKEEVFVRHIENHLDKMSLYKGQKVCCKICGEDIDSIFKEHEKELKGVQYT